MFKKPALHWRILIGMLLGVATGVLALQFSGGPQFITSWIKPWGTVFINALKLIAIPLIVASLIKGITDLKDITQLSKMGIRTFGLYTATTITAVCIGLVLVNLIQPGLFVKEATRQEMVNNFGADVGQKLQLADANLQNGPLQPVIDLVPQNFFQAASSNGNMLQVIFFTVFFAIGLLLVTKEKAQPVIAFFDGTNEVILKLIDILMLAAPFGVFALLAALVAESPSADIFKALGAYAFTVVAGLAVLILLIYPSLIKAFTNRSYFSFYKAIAPAQLLAFSSSSSAATLPVTMERVQEHLGVDEEVAGFVLPIGATINMDGTSLYQAVASVFIAQAFGYHLTLADQLTIVVTATLASIGSAAVPGAGLLMLVVVLESIGVNPAGIALIIAIDRPLDMCRTTVNVTSDAAVAIVIAATMGKLHTPQPKELDDHRLT